jgi:hypothetical protein
MMKWLSIITACIVLAGSCDLSVFYPKEEEEQAQEITEAAPRGHTGTYVVASVDGLVRKTTTTTNNTDALEFLAREVPYLYDEDENIHYYTDSSNPPPLINDLFFRANNNAAFDFDAFNMYFGINSDLFPFSSYLYGLYNKVRSFDYDVLSDSSLHKTIFEPNHLPAMEQEKLLFADGTFSIYYLYGISIFFSFIPTGMRNEIVYTTETSSGEYHFDTFTLPYNGSYDIPQDNVYDQDVPVTLYSHFYETNNTAAYYFVQTMHYYETLDVHVTEEYESLNRALYKSVTVYIDNALTIDAVQTSAMVDSFSQTGNTVTFVLAGYANPMKFEIARITTRNESTGETQMKILKLQ